MENAHILVVEDSEVTLFKLKAILVRLGYTVTTHSDPVKALEWLKSAPALPNLIFSDVHMPQMNGFDFVRRVKTSPATASIPVILLTSATDVADRISGLQAGADDYLSKAITPTELELRVKAMLARSNVAEGTFSQSAARTISVFSLRGGVGTTSVAVNLTIALSQLWGFEAILWDMALLAGHGSFLLNLKPAKTISMFADWQEAAVEEKLVTDLLLKHTSGIKFFPAPLKPSEAELVTLKTIDLVWPHLQGNSAFLVVDCGNHFTEPVLTILERSDTIVLMLAPELASVKSAADAMQIFTQMGMPAEKIVLVVNNTFPNHHTPLNKYASIFGDKPMHEIPYDTTNFIKAINAGEPILLAAPKSEASLAISSLAYKLSAKQMETNKLKQTSQLLESVRRLNAAN
jgi:pilus assembly protein CpaE